MSFTPKFIGTSKRSKTNSKELWNENGTPLYSEMRTEGTKKAEELLSKLVKPNPVPPHRVNGGGR